MDEFNGNGDREEVFSRAVKAGKRTYFFDVKSTRGNDLYITITESKKRFHEEGKFSYEKHKIFLYKEDFDKFIEGLQEVLDKVDELRASGEYPDLPPNTGREGQSSEDISFEDL